MHVRTSSRAHHSALLMWVPARTPVLCTHASAVVLLLASVASSGRALDVTRTAAAPSSHLANNRFTSQGGVARRHHQRPLPPSKLAAQRQRRVVSDLQGQVASLQAQLAAAEAELVLIERDPPSSSHTAPQYAKRRTQTAARPGPQVCKRYEMGLRVSKINTRCCGRTNEHCSNGVPSKCDTGCASEVLAFWPRCHTVFQRATPARSVASFKRVLQLCRAAQARPHAFPANARALTVMNGRLSSQQQGGGPYVGVYTSQLQQLIDGSYASVMDADLRKVSLVDAKRLRHLVLFGACVDDDDGLWVCGRLPF